MEQEDKALLLTEEAFYKLYKADVGVVVNGQHCLITDENNDNPINGQYRKINGAFMTDDRRTSTADGLLIRDLTYMLTFKDLSDGALYYMQERLRVAPTPANSTYSSYYYEPPASASKFECVAEPALRHTSIVHIYTVDGGYN